MIIIWMVLTIVVVLILVVVLLYYLSIISHTLNSIGGDGNSYLAKLRLGLRAIETETGHLPTEVTKLNDSLKQTAAGLKAVDGHIVESINKALAQPKYK